MSTVSIRLPDDLMERASAQAAAQGISLDDYVAMTLASRLGAPAAPGRVREILARLGQDNPPLPGDELDPRSPPPVG